METKTFEHRFSNVLKTLRLKREQVKTEALQDGDAYGVTYICFRKYFGLEKKWSKFKRKCLVWCSCEGMGLVKNAIV